MKRSDRSILINDFELERVIWILNAFSWHKPRKREGSICLNLSINRMIDAGIFYVIPPPPPSRNAESRFMHRGTSPRPAYTHLSIYVNVTARSKLVVNRTRVCNNVWKTGVPAAPSMKRNISIKRIEKGGRK